jgi:hypothetical protein
MALTFQNFYLSRPAIYPAPFNFIFGAVKSLDTDFSEFLPVSSNCIPSPFLYVYIYIHIDFPEFLPRSFNYIPSPFPRRKSKKPGTHSEKSKYSALYSKCTRLLTFEIFLFLGEPWSGESQICHGIHSARKKSTPNCAFM